MKIDLKYFLNKNKLTLSHFCTINNIVSFEQLCRYCAQKNITPVELDFYNQQIPVKNKIEKKVNEVHKTTKPKKSPPGRPRKASKVTKKRTASSKDNT